ncbi:MAG: hypothetical protein H7228_03590 [Polaromonas sp.]|nr:hypothetical protein [Polaromonas sp.]
MTLTSNQVNPVNPGKVIWSGENPGIYLKDASGAWQSLSVYFRVVTSPFGPGTGVVVLGAPQVASGWPGTSNLCLSTNQALMRWLVSDFVSRFASFRDAPGLRSMAYLPATSCQTSGDGQTFHEEALQGDQLSVVLRWENLSEPFAVDVPPAMSATGEHQMYSVFVEAQSGSIKINGIALPGQVIERDFLGRRLNTAFLAFCESWIAPVLPVLP